jgi:hypothetical protein
VFAFGRLPATPTSTDTVPESVELAQHLTAALNAHDVDALVELFSDEGGGPTVTADRYAWLKSEIRLWAQRQADTNIRVDPYSYSNTAQGAAWEADVFRDDWTAVGIAPLQVTNSISVRNGKIASYTETPRNAIEAEKLGALWRPGSTPEHLITWLGLTL